MNPHSMMKWVVAAAGVALIALVWTLFSGSAPPSTEAAAMQAYFEVRRLYFAAGVLGTLFFLLLVAVFCAVAPQDRTSSPDPHRGQMVFETLIQIVPPLMTLVLGFYFGQSQNH